MPHPCPHHCPKPGGVGGGVLLVLAVVVIAAVARPVVHAAELVLEVVLITAASLAGLAVLAGTAYAAIRARRWQARNRQALPWHARTAARLSEPHRPAIEARRDVIDGTVIRDGTRDRRHP